MDEQQLYALLCLHNNSQKLSKAWIMLSWKVLSPLPSLPRVSVSHWDDAMVHLVSFWEHCLSAYGWSKSEHMLHLQASWLGKAVFKCPGLSLNWECKCFCSIMLKKGNCFLPLPRGTLTIIWHCPTDMTICSCSQIQRSVELSSSPVPATCHKKLTPSVFLHPPALLSNKHIFTQQ